VAPKRNGWMRLRCARQNLICHMQSWVVLCFRKTPASILSF
jgi:hypothetical protein